MNAKTTPVKIQTTHILHEVLFALSGFKTCFASNQLAIKDMLHPSEGILLKKVLDIGEECMKLRKYIQKIQFNQWEMNLDIGLYLITFVEHLDQVLEPYLATVVELEHDITQNEKQATLQYVWSRMEKYSQVLIGLNSLVTEIEVQGSKGCLILQHLQEKLASEVGALRVAIHHITVGVNKVFINEIMNWVLYGGLIDEFGEFFIEKNKEGLTSFEQYSINFAMLPNFVGHSQGQKILTAGQTVMFLRQNPYQSTKDEQVIIDESGITGEIRTGLLQRVKELEKLSVWNEELGIDRLLAEASSCVTKQLWMHAVLQARLHDQLCVVKEFLLLGRGELFHELVNQIDLQQSRCVRHLDLNILVQESARKVSVGEERFQRFSLELSKPLEGDFKWSSISVKYDVQSPLQLLFTPVVLASYNSLFRFLLRLKAIEVKMVAMWLNTKSTRDSSPENSRELLNNLRFLVNNLQYYLHVNVLDSQFVLLERAVEKSCTFDEILKAHSVFLSNIVSQSFVQDSLDSEVVIENRVYHCIDKILTLCEEYCQNKQQCLEESNEAGLEDLSYKLQLEACIERLLQLLSGLTKDTGTAFGKCLPELLLRLNFNYYLSTHFAST